MERQMLKSFPSNGNIVNRWITRLMLILSLVALLVSALIWIILLVLYEDANAVQGQGLNGLGSVILIMMLIAPLIIAASVGSALALIGLISEIIAKKKIHWLLAISLSLNALAGPIPLLCIWIAENYKDF